jgi:hypothetical protein
MGIGSKVRILPSELDARSIKKGTHLEVFEVVGSRDIDSEVWYRLSGKGGIWPHWALVTAGPNV